MRGGSQVESRTADFEGEHEEALGFVFLKAAHQLLASFYSRLAVQDQAVAAEDGGEESRQWRSNFAELGEDQHLFLFGANHFGDLAQACPLAAIGFALCAIAQPMGRVVADLPEAHEKRQYEAFALDARGIGELLGKIFHRLLIKCGLLTAELAPQRAVGAVRLLHQALGEAGEFLCRSQQAGIDEIEDGPQVSQPVLDWCERQAGTALEPLGDPCLASLGVLIAWASSRMTRRQERSAIQGRAKERALVITRSIC
jgi:hypothetical protein